MKRLALIVILVLAARPAAAADPSTVAYVAAMSADWGTTVHFLARGNREANPLVNWLDDRPAAMLAAGAAMDLTAVWFVTRHVKPAHPRLAQVLTYAGIASRAFCASRNLLLTAPTPHVAPVRVYSGPIR